MATKKKKKKKLYKTTKLFIVLDIIVAMCFFLMYGPYDKFRNIFVTTAMNSMHHQYFARIFFSEEAIQKILAGNYFITIDENANTDEVKIDTGEKKKYKDKYEEELLTREPGNDLYKILNVSIGTASGYVVAIYDPLKVKLISTKQFNVGGYGEKVTTMCERYDGVVCINGGGFADSGYGSDRPIGVVIQNGEITWGKEKANKERNNIIGMTKDGKLKLLNNATGNEALEANIHEGLVFGPFLIVNGKSLEIVGDPWGKAPRVAIAQRKDGVMMFVVIDGENYINGASLQDMVDLLKRYGAYNAANLDGGQSTSLVVKGQLYNNPAAAAKKQGGRYVVTGWGLIK